MEQLKSEFIRGFRGCYRYGFFAPFTAAWLAVTRPGSYLRHLKALYRLDFWKGRRWP
jgi:hypothetical protein